MSPPFFCWLETINTWSNSQILINDLGIRAKRKPMQNYWTESFLPHALWQIRQLGSEDVAAWPFSTESYPTQQGNVQQLWLLWSHEAFNGSSPSTELWAQALFDVQNLQGQQILAHDTVKSPRILRMSPQALVLLQVRLSRLFRVRGS